MGLLQKILPKSQQEEQAKRLVAEADETVRKYLQVSKKNMFGKIFGPIDVVYDPSRRSASNELTYAETLGQPSNGDSLICFYEPPSPQVAEHEVAHVWYYRTQHNEHFDAYWKNTPPLRASLLASESIAYGVELRHLPHFSLQILARDNPSLSPLTRIVIEFPYPELKQAFDIPLALDELMQIDTFMENQTPLDVADRAALRAQTAAYALLGNMCAQSQRIMLTSAYPCTISSERWKCISLELDPFTAKKRQGLLSNLVHTKCTELSEYMLDACRELAPHIAKHAPLRAK